jgi:Tol biopolymer transport system component
MTKTAHTLLTAVALASAAIMLLIPGMGSAAISPIPVPSSWEVAFTSPMDGMSDIYAMTSDGKAVNLTHDRNVRSDVQPHWSPDGSQILFTRYWSTGGATIMRATVNANGQKLVNLTPSFNRSVQNIDPNWSPDGSRIVFASNRDGNFDLYTMNTEGQKVARLTKTNSPTANIEPDWAPNGKGVVFSRQGTGTDRFETSSLWVVSASRTVTQLTSPKRFEGDRGAVWSSDGTKIAFYSDRAGSSDLYVLDMARGIGPERVTWSGKSETDPAWVDDGTRLVYVSTVTGDTEFWMLNLKGMGPSPEQQLTFDGQNKTHPDWKSTTSATPGTDPAEVVTNGAISLSSK